MKNLLFALGLIGWAGALPATAAVLVTFDDKGFFDFDDVTTQYAAQGIVFSASEDGRGFNPEAVGRVFDDGSPLSPPMSLSNFILDGFIRADVVSFNFSSATRNISFGFNPAQGGPSGPGDNTTVNVYDPSSVLFNSYLIGTLYAGGPTVIDGAWWWDVVIPDVGVGRIDLLQPDDDWGYYVDNILFAPEPGTLALLGLGLAGLGLSRRRKA